MWSECSGSSLWRAEEGFSQIIPTVAQWMDGRAARVKGRALGFLLQKPRWKITVTWINVNKGGTERDWLKIAVLWCHAQAWPSISNWTGNVWGEAGTIHSSSVSSEGTFLIFLRKTLFLASARLLCWVSLNFLLCRTCQKIDTNVYVIIYVTYDLW